MDKIDTQLLNRVLSKIDKLISPEDLKANFREADAFLFHNNSLTPVKNYSKVDINSLIGIDYQKEKLLKNTQKFSEGRLANHAVLWGERGTGKSSLVKAMLPIFANKDLKLIQVLKEDILNIFKLYSLIHQNPEFRFIIFIDDLSFEEQEKDYKEFKTIIDGGIYEIPENLLFYVTSNKKNLIPIKFSDRALDEYSRTSDILEEKLSLIDRFGLRLGFYKFDKRTYLSIVEFYAEKFGINMEKEKLHKLAMEYATEAGSLSGRTALNFIKSL